MRYSKEHKAKTRKKILEAAGRVFRRQGYVGGGVDAVMKEAGLTHGGFYAHFPNKEALFAEALETSLKSRGEQTREALGETSGPERVRAFLDHYLSPLHRAHPEAGCPVPPLVSELGRSSEELHQHFGEALAEWSGELAREFTHLPEGERAKAALGTIAAAVGGMTLARSVDDELAGEILAASRELVRRAFLSDTRLPSEEN